MKYPKANYRNKIAYTFLFFQLIVKITLAQTGTIKGKIFDTIEKVELAYSKVLIMNTNIESETNYEGVFIFENVPVGIYDVIIRSSYPDTILRDIVVAQDEVLQLNITYPSVCPYTSQTNTCPVCKMSDKSSPIIYGKPTMEMIKKSRKGEVQLGGCIISNCSPKWYCSRDKISF
jgi:hypothetical protein